MVEINIKTSTHPYKVHIGANIRFDISQFLPKKYTSILVITDSQVENLYLEDICKSLNHEKVFTAVVPSGEQSKSIDQYYKLQTKAIQYGLNRHSLIIALGGGVVGDLAGFVAATFVRGIDYIQVPTTILAHDSSVGGKVAINHELGKNMIGNFYPPQAVVYDVETVRTLSQNEVRSGYAEIIKEALISDETLFNKLLEVDLSQLSNDALVQHLEAGIRVKAQIVEADEREAGIRQYLNLGHTLGHAIEAELGYGKMTHGEAIAIGMIFALRLSEAHFGVAMPHDALLSWMKDNGYPTSLSNLTAEQLVEKMKSDKKVVSDQIPMVLLKEVGEATTAEFSHEDLLQHLELFLRELVKS